MKIESSTVNMKSTQSTVVKTNLLITRSTMTGLSQEDLLGLSGTGQESNEDKDKLSISNMAKELLDSSKISKDNLAVLTDDEIKAAYKDYKQELELNLLEQMFFQLTGRRIRLKVFTPDLMARKNNTSIIPGAIARPVTLTLTTQKVEMERYESQSMSFETQATVKTSDGKEINVDISLSMSQEFYEKVSLSSTQLRFCDPLVINFDAPSAALSDTKFAFDLDCDGTEDQISQLMKGSGYLALDLNEDGVINDGGELFGAKSGDGFADLAKYDADSNGWIDENDEVFNKLRVWHVNDEGEYKLVG